MTRRSPLLRFLAMALATIQLVSPALVVMADAMAVKNAVNESVAHIESGSTDRCPQVHAPDCAMCRYLSTSVAALPGSPVMLVVADEMSAPTGQVVATRSVDSLLPHGRAPPLG